MSKTNYVVIRQDLEGCHDIIAVSPLLKTEEDAIAAVREAVETDIEPLDFVNEKLIMRSTEDQLAEGDWVDLSSLGLAYVYKIIEVDVPSKKKHKEETSWEEEFQAWYSKLEKTLKLPKVGDFYPKQFCMGMLSRINEFDPRWCFDRLGFPEYIPPIDWEQLFTTGHLEFEDVDSCKISFDYKLHMEGEDGWYTEIRFKVDDIEEELEYELNADPEETKTTRYKAISFCLGQIFQFMLTMIHPAFQKYREYCN